MKYIVVDFEMNPVSRKYKEQKAICESEIIEIGAVFLDEEYTERDSFQIYVKPCFSRSLRRSIVQLTGITDEKLQQAPDFTKAMKLFFEWCLQGGEQLEVIQWSESDYLQVHGEMRQKQYPLTEQEKKLMEGWYDLQKEYGGVIGAEQQMSLGNAVMLTGKDFEGKQHDALYDARNTARIFRTVRIPEERKSSLGTVIEVMKESAPLVSTLGEIFDFSKLCALA